MTHIIINVEGAPVPKQSMKMGRGHSYTPQHIKDWQNTVSWCAKEAALNSGWVMTSERVKVTSMFRLPDLQRRDLDNLIKATNDSLKGIIIKDDDQIYKSTEEKEIVDGNPGVTILVEIIKR